MKSISLGQYYPANSVLHRLDPRIKVILAILYIVASFLCKNILSFAALAVSAVIIILVGRIPLKTVLKGLRPVIIILAFTSFINVFWTKGEIPIIEWKFTFDFKHVSKLSL